MLKASLSCVVMGKHVGLQVPDYLVVGEEYGDPHSGWTGNGKGTKGVGGILAAGYWNNSWSFDPRCGYLK